MIRRISRDALERHIGQALKAVSVVLLLIIAVFPFYWMLTMSFRPYGDVQLHPLRLIPRWQDVRAVLAPLACIGDHDTDVCQSAVRNSSYAAVLIHYRFLTFIRNSLIIAGMAAIISLIISVPAAYALARLDFRGKQWVSNIILLVYMFPSIVISIPLFVFFVRLQRATGLQLRSPVGVTIVYLAGTLPVALYMLRGYFLSIPREVEQAALIDGATRLGVVWRITLPLATPAIASVALYVFMIAWNEFLYALLFLVDAPAAWTLPLGLQQLDNQEVPRHFLMAGSVIISVPVIALFAFGERFLTSGLMAGGVKG
jgi:multiple sugar transport system permease protein